MPPALHSATTASEQRLIKTLPRKGLRFVGAVREEVPRRRRRGHSSFLPAIPRSRPLRSCRSRTSAVIRTQDYFSDGIVEDITTALSRNRAFFVIARNSSFTYKGDAGQEPSGRAGARRSLPARRQRAQVGQSGARHRAIDRGRLRPASVGRPLRRRHVRDFRAAGSDRHARGRSDRAAARESGDRSRQPRRDRRSCCLRSVPARPGQLEPLDQGGKCQGAAALLRRNRQGSRLFDPVWAGCLLLSLRQGQRLGVDFR